ncbi:MFS sugar transporter-like protein [Mollisia scopiformis]|uniref:MFS sugar transporter-like protein n=1 Tax=Mollisia scopiformis TaxID=149040 RepID=A0A194XI02_MOLSC|nr:MFS sugar transporter-like protein [Mollisia scopiformis]KUJ19850.1 MFS sugar transporter-like protein [Mollisia scopiformis]
MSEKQVHDISAVDHVDDTLEKPEAVQTKIVMGDEGFNQAMLKEPPSPFNVIALQLYMISVIGFCCSTSNGFDSSLFGSLLANKSFLNFFAVGSVGLKAGIVSSMNQIGAVVSLPFVGPAIDTFGRKAGMFIGGSVIILGVIIQGTCIHTHSVGQFMAGRFFMGMGINLISAAGPVYVVEVSHPAYRGIVTALYNVFWPVGALVASCACRGTITWGNNASWILPIWLQMMFPGVVWVFAYFLPESPRWNYTNGKADKAKAFLTKYHGNGNPESEWVKLQMWEYEAYLELEGADKRWWDYRALFRDRASVYRLMSNCLVSLFGQWAGNGVVSYFLAGVLDTAGVKDPVIQTDLFTAMNAVQVIFAVLGSTLVDKVGRRPLLIWVNVGCAVCWIGVSTASGIQASRGDKASSAATVAMIYIFQVVYSVGWTPLQALYPVEVLSFEMRAKGMAFSGLFVNIGTLVNQFGFPVALANIKWKTYLVFMVWCAIQAIIIYFLIPETKNRTLEELDEIFKAKNPMKASIAKKKVNLDADANIIGVEDLDGSDVKA